MFVFVIYSVFYIIFTTFFLSFCSHSNFTWFFSWKILILMKHSRLLKSCDHPAKHISQCVISCEADATHTQRNFYIWRSKIIHKDVFHSNHSKNKLKFVKVKYMKIFKNYFFLWQWEFFQLDKTNTLSNVYWFFMNESLLITTHFSFLQLSVYCFESQNRDDFFSKHLLTIFFLISVQKSNVNFLWLFF